jgi:Flp pilus assembly protein TadG
MKVTRRQVGRDRESEVDAGAAAVEFALVLPVLLALLCGIIDFGLVFGQSLQLRNLGREAVRLAAVNHGAAPGVTAAAQSTQLLQAACTRAGSFTGVTTVQLERPGGAAVGDTVRVVVTSSLTSSTGLLSSILDGRDQHATAEGRLEQRATWSTVTVTCP